MSDTRPARVAAGRAASLRAGDTDRAATCAWLDEAAADGQLDPDEHAARLTLAYRARTLGDLDALVEDLQEPTGIRLPRAPGRSMRARTTSRRRFAALAGAAGTVLLAGVLGAMLGAASAPTAPPPARWTDPVAIAHFVDAYRAEFGDTVADEVRFFEERVLVERQSAETPERAVSYRYDGEFDTDGDSSRPERTVPSDLAAVDPAALAGLLAGAPESVRLPDGVVDQVAVETDEHGGLVRIHVTDRAGRYGTVETTFDGTVVALYPHTPDR